MGITTISAIIALGVSVSATYNAYVLRGGRLAWSQVLTALATVSLMISLVLGQIGELAAVQIVGVELGDVFAILGFLLLFAGSLKLRFSLK